MAEGVTNLPQDDRHNEHEILTLEDFETSEQYEAYIEEHPEAAPAPGASVKVGLSGVEIVGDYWFIGAVLLAAPLLYFLKKKVDLYFLARKAATLAPFVPNPKVDEETDSK